MSITRADLTLCNHDTIPLAERRSAACRVPQRRWELWICCV